MKTIAHVVLVAAIASLGSIAMAQDSFGYGMAGCGLGTQIFENKPGKIPQIFQHITNKSASQTSAVTSGTSGCVESAQEMAAVYISINHVAFMKDVSRGSGETITNLSGIYKCENANVLADTLKTHFNDIFEEGRSTEETSRKVEEVIVTNKIGCNELS
ncbi:MAG: hypothetical protein CL677_06695 [Bdellovibrionaceae bacterium]|nr:hypothetical protein [Pseudobdellovibrionaceae bacterium]